MVKKNVVIELIPAVNGYLEGLSELLVEVVNQGASVGFLSPLNRHEGEDYWISAASLEILVYIARVEEQIVGAVQLQLATKQNGQHRAEIAKLMTHPSFRRLGIAQSLMKAAEEKAREAGRTLLVLDTRDGDPSNQLYVSLGYQLAGQIPNYARSSDGTYHATNIYYKELQL